MFFDTVMGRSQLVNQTGSLWGLERQDDYSLFLGGRQRGDGHQQIIHMRLDDDNGRLYVSDDAVVNRGLVLITGTTKPQSTGTGQTPNPNLTVTPATITFSTPILVTSTSATTQPPCSVSPRA